MMTVVANVDRRKSGLKGEGIQRRRDSDCRRRVFSEQFLNSGDRGRQSRSRASRSPFQAGLLPQQSFL